MSALQVVARRRAQRCVSPPRTSRLWYSAQRAIALLACIGCAPLLALIYLAVRLDSRGPFLFRQRRRGLHGRMFEILKIRTLRVGAESATALGIDRRSAAITRVGRILRELKLDELPQLWNVVRGEMALIGPRPIPLALESELRDLLLGFGERYAVRPGLSNLAQVAIDDNAVGSARAADWERRFTAEVDYVRHASPGYDLVLIALTCAFLLRRLLRKLGPAPRRRPRWSGQAPATEILGVPVSNLDYAGVLAHIRGWVARKRREYVAVCPVHSLTEALWDREHLAALRGAALVTADGMPVVWTQRWFGHEGASRVYGPDLMLLVLEQAELRGWRVAFYGGRPDRLSQLQARMRERYPRLRVVAAISPPFRVLSPEEDKALTARLQHARPDIVLVGLGAPKQEAWMRAHRSSVPGVKLGVGAAFDFHAGAVRQAPAWIQRVGMEWAFRLALEPRRLFVRYAKANPTYVLLIALQALRCARSGRRPLLTPEAR